MKIILTDDVSGLGDVGDTVNVKPGYARNFLIPRGKAFEAQTASAKAIEHKMLQVNAKKKAMKIEAEKVGLDLRNILLELKIKVAESGGVFGSINSRDIAAGLQARNYDIDRRRVLLEEPIRKVGTHFVEIKLHPEVKAQLKIDVVGEIATRKEEDLAIEEIKNNIEDASNEIEADSSEEAETEADSNA